MKNVSLNPIVKTIPVKTALVLAATALTTAPILSAEALLSESFLSNQRLVQDLPATAAWYGSNGSLSELPGGGVRLETSGSTQTLVSYFTDSGAVSVGPGEAIQAIYHFELVNPQGGEPSIRPALLYSGGSRVSDDTFGTSNAIFSSYVGYGVFFNPEAAVPVAANETEISIRQRIREANALLNAAAPWDNLTVDDPGNATESGTISILAGQRYTGMLWVENAGDTVVITHQIFSGNELMSQMSYTSSANLLTGFDAFGVSVLGGRADRTDAFDLFGFEVIHHAAEGDAVLNENFLPGQRLVQDLPNTSAWYGASGALTELPEGGVFLDATAGTRHLITYFTDSGTVSVAPGEIISATYSFSLVNPQDDATTFRLGLLNSGGSRVSDDSTGISNAVFSAYTGFGSFFNPVTESQEAHSIRQRLRENNALLHSAAPWNNLSAAPTGHDPSPPIALVEGERYTGILSVYNTGDGLIVSHQILHGGELLTWVASSVTEDIVTEFDTFAIAALGGREDRTDAVILHAFNLAVSAAGPGLTWAGFPVRPDGWVNTRNFLGFIYPVGDFVYVWNLDTYMHLPEANVRAEGAWAYAINQ